MRPQSQANTQAARRWGAVRPSRTSGYLICGCSDEQRPEAGHRGLSARAPRSSESLRPGLFALPEAGGDGKRLSRGVAAADSYHKLLHHPSCESLSDHEMPYIFSVWSISCPGHDASPDRHERNDRDHRLATLVQPGRPTPRIQLVPTKPEKLAYVQRLGVSLTVLPHRLHPRPRFPFPSPPLPQRNPGRGYWSLVTRTYE